MDTPGKMIYEGERYEAVLPDTLDLAKRAELALNGIGGTIDPELHYTMYFVVHYLHKTPDMHHHSPDTTCDPKYAESFPLMRIMCGSNQYADIEAGQRAELLSRIKDGLYWNFNDSSRPWRKSYIPGFDGVVKEEDVSNVGGNATMLRALVVWRELSGDSDWDKPIRELVRGSRRIAIDRGDYSYYPDGGFGEPFNYPRSGWLKTDEAKGETEGGEGSVVSYQGHIRGLMRWYSISGDEEALDFAARLTRYVMLPKFWGGLPDPNGDTKGLTWHIAARLPDPACIAGNEQGHWYSHFHARAIALRGMLEYGRLVGDERVLEFVRRAYEYTLTLAIPRIGWVNCFPVEFNRCEACSLGDMVALGIRLSDAGLGDYWDDVDAVVRNHLVEQQLVYPDLLERAAAAHPERTPGDWSTLYPGQTVSENVIKRSLGNFAGTSFPSSIPHPEVMQCCTGNGTQGLYYAWEGTLREEGGSAQVNLLLNRAGKSVDINSYLPYEGKVVIHNKSCQRVSVRIPSWVMRKELRAEVTGVLRSLSWVGNYLIFDGLKPGDKINLGFPVRETTARYTICSGTKDEEIYTCVFRGSTLVDISPRDEAPTSYPLYQREHLRKDKAPLEKVMRFVPQKTILKW